MSEVTVVIGAGSIGQAIARRVSAGKQVLLADLHQGNAEVAAEVLRNAGFEVSTAIVEVSSRESLQALVETATGLGDITGVIHAAGVSPGQASPAVDRAVDLYGTAVLLEELGTSSRAAAPGSSFPRSPGTVWAPSPPSTMPRSRLVRQRRDAAHARVRGTSQLSFPACSSSPPCLGVPVEPDRFHWQASWPPRAGDRIREFLSRDPSVMLLRPDTSGASARVGMVRSPGAQLLGRQPEREVLGRLLEAARGGHGGVLVVHGEAGVGKTALLEDAVEAGREFRVARTAGVEGEMELAYAALQQLCSPILELNGRLPHPAARRACRRVRTQCRAGPESVPGRTGGPRPAVGGRRGAAAAVCCR